jgi:hypothetical protein
MFHLSAFFVSISTTADTDVPAVVDDILTIQNNHFVLQRPYQLLAGAAMSATISRAKLASPSMRQIASPYIRPLILAAKPPTNPNIWLLDHNPFIIPPFEEVQMQGTSAIAMGNENFTGLIWLADNITPLPIGNIIPLRITSTTAAVANAWTSIALTFTDTLPSGVYAMVFSEHRSANGIAHRWIFSNQLERPGFMSMTNLTDRLPYAQAKGQFGVMGRFRSNDLPRLQVMCNAADASHEVYAHIVRVGNLAG